MTFGASSRETFELYWSAEEKRWWRLLTSRRCQVLIYMTFWPVEKAPRLISSRKWPRDLGAHPQIFYGTRRTWIAATRQHSTRGRRRASSGDHANDCGGLSDPSHHP